MLLAVWRNCRASLAVKGLKRRGGVRGTLRDCGARMPAGGRTLKGGINEVFHGHVRTNLDTDPGMAEAKSALRRALKNGEVESGQ